MVRSLLLRLVDYPPILDRVRWIIEAGHRAQRRVIERELSPLPGNILDIACGTGVFSHFFPEHLYTGIDLGEHYIRRAQKKFPRRKFAVMDALHLTFPDASFDRILVTAFLHHLSESDVRKALMEMQRVLRPGGTLLLIEDVPTRSRANVVGRTLQAFDAGGRIRTTEAYMPLLQEYFIIIRTEPLRAGFWDYAVFVLQRRK